MGINQDNVTGSGLVVKFADINGRIEQVHTSIQNQAFLQICELYNYFTRQVRIIKRLKKRRLLAWNGK